MRPALTSTKNPIVQDARRLHAAKERHRSGRILIEGPTLVAEAVKSGIEFITLFIADGEQDESGSFMDSGVSVIPVSEHVLAAIGTTVNPRAPIGIARRPVASSKLGAVDCLVLHDVQEPGNAGTMARTAVALGLHTVSVGGSVDMWSPKTLRAGAGAQFGDVPHVVASIEELRSAGLHTVALVVSGGESLDVLDSRGPVAIVVGNEAKGLARATVDSCDTTVTLDMAGRFESLNAATAASIAMWERARRRPG